MQAASHNQVLDIPLDEQLLQDFDAYVPHLFEILQTQLGFHSPMLFMLDEKDQRLVLVHSPTSLSFSLAHPTSLLVKAFTTKSIETSRSAQQIFEGKSPAEEGQTSSLFVALPIVVFGESLGVLLLASKQENELSNLERVFLQNFAAQIGIHLFTSWALKQFSSESVRLQKENDRYRELIQVKKSFLLDVQELLLRYVRDGQSAQTKEEALQALSYLNALLMISDKAVPETVTAGKPESMV